MESTFYANKKQTFLVNRYRASVDTTRMDISPFIPNCAGKELRQALLPFIANAMSCLPSEQDKPEVIYLLKKAGIVFALKDNKVALNLKAIEGVSETPQVQQHKKHYRTYCYTNTERLTQQKRSLCLALYQW